MIAVFGADSKIYSHQSDTVGLSSPKTPRISRDIFKFPYWCRVDQERDFFRLQRADAIVLERLNSIGPSVEVCAAPAAHP